MSCHKFQLTSDTSLPFHFIFCSIVFWSRLFSCLCLSARLSDCPFVYSSILSICFCFCFVLNILQLTHCLVKYAWITSNLNDWNLKTDLVHLFVNGNGKSVFYICICDCNKFVIVSVKMKKQKTKKDLFYKKKKIPETRQLWDKTEIEGIKIDDSAKIETGMKKLLFCFFQSRMNQSVRLIWQDVEKSQSRAIFRRLWKSFLFQNNLICF